MTYSNPPFKKCKATVKETEVVKPQIRLGSYEETARIFAIRPAPPFTDECVLWDTEGFSLPALPPIRGGLFTPPFVYVPDRTATFSLTTYKRIARGERHHNYQESLYKQCSAHGRYQTRVCWMCEAVEETDDRKRAAAIRRVLSRDMVLQPTKPKVEKPTLETKKTKQLDIRTLATAHRIVIPKHVEGTKTEFVLPKRRKAAKKRVKKKRKKTVKKHPVPRPIERTPWGNAVPIDEQITNLVAAFTPLNLESLAVVRAGIPQRPAPPSRTLTQRKFTKQLGLRSFFK